MPVLLLFPADMKYHSAAVPSSGPLTSQATMIAHNGSNSVTAFHSKDKDGTNNDTRKVLLPELGYLE